MNDSDNNNWLLTEFDLAFDDLQADALHQIEKDIAEIDAYNRYDSPQFLAKGGMKSIFKVHDRLADRTVAMARLNDPQNSVARELFVREARISALLQHPNIVPVYDLGIDQDDEPYFVMKLLEGKTLQQQWFEETRSSNDAEMRRNMLLEKFISVCDAVAYAHSRGLMHLDLKPTNIWCGNFGETMVGDWGLARLSEDCCGEVLLESELSSVSEATLFGLIKGTPGYMAPEMADKLKSASFQTDIFSLGAVLYFIITGTTPYEAKIPEQIIELTREGKWQLPSDRFPSLKVAPGLEAVIARAMALNQSERYPNAVALGNEIRRYLSGFPTHAEEAGFMRQLKLLYRRHRHICHVIAFSLIMIFTLVTGFVIRLQHTTHEAKTIAKQLQREKSEKMHLAQNAVRELYRQGRSAFLSGDYKTALTTFKEAAELGIIYEDINYQLAGIYLHYLRFDDCLRHLKLAEFETEALNPHELRKEIDRFITENRQIDTESIPNSKLMNLSLRLHSLNFAFFGKALRERAFLNARNLEDRIAFFKELLKVLNPQQKNWNIEFTELTDGMKLNLSGHTMLRWMPGLKYLKLRELDVSGCNIPYFEMSYQLKLHSLNLRGTNYTNISFIQGMPLRELHLPKSLQRGFEFITPISTLKRLHIPQELSLRPELKKLPKTIKVIVD